MRRSLQYEKHSSESTYRGCIVKSRVLSGKSLVEVAHFRVKAIGAVQIASAPPGGNNETHRQTNSYVHAASCYPEARYVVRNTSLGSPVDNVIRCRHD
jgi:hypothetical protein